MQLVFAAATVVVRIATVVQFIQVAWERSTVCGVDRDGYSLFVIRNIFGNPSFSLSSRIALYTLGLGFEERGRTSYLRVSAL